MTAERVLGRVSLRGGDWRGDPEGPFEIVVRPGVDGLLSMVCRSVPGADPGAVRDDVERAGRLNTGRPERMASASQDDLVADLVLVEGYSVAEAAAAAGVTYDAARRAVDLAREGVRS